jgi:hypothetical protein
MCQAWIHPITQEAQRHYVCSACMYRYRAVRRSNGVRELRQMKGYSIDLPKKQFRKLHSFFGLFQWLEVISFDSPKGFRLHREMHYAWFVDKLKPVEWQQPKKME